MNKKERKAAAIAKKQAKAAAESAAHLRIMADRTRKLYEVAGAKGSREQRDELALNLRRSASQLDATNVEQRRATEALERHIARDFWNTKPYELTVAKLRVIAAKSARAAASAEFSAAYTAQRAAIGR